ncbi:hypothetical protein WP8S17E03_21320 [Aeromonas caviae]|nr:hypothetical protein WP8S17E03_21320 [Aeromonas caviae]
MTLIEHLTLVEETRSEINRKHNLVDVMFLVISVYRSSYHLTPASNRCLVYATLVRTSFGINFRPFLNML